MKRLIIFLLIGIFFVGFVSAEIIFEDDFDSHSDWSPNQPIYPNTQANAAADGDSNGVVDIIELMEWRR